MNYSILKNKKASILMLFCSIFFSSCISVAKIVVGFKNPKVTSVTNLKKIRNEIFDNDFSNDFYYKGKKKDSSFMEDILNLSFNGSLNVFDRNGQRVCFKNANCITDQINILNSNKDSLIFNCEKPHLKKEIEDLVNLDSNESFLIDNSKYYVFFYWSSFMSKQKSIKEEFDYLKNNLDKSKYTFIRVNCDYLNTWGLKENKKIKLKFKKENNYIDVVFKSIPWSN